MKKFLVGKAIGGGIVGGLLFGSMGGAVAAPFPVQKGRMAKRLLCAINAGMFLKRNCDLSE